MRLRMTLGRGPRLIIGVMAMLLAAGCAGIPQHHAGHSSSHLLMSQGRTRLRGHPARIRISKKKHRSFHRVRIHRRVR